MPRRWSCGLQAVKVYKSYITITLFRLEKYSIDNLDMTNIATDINLGPEHL